MAQPGGRVCGLPSRYRTYLRCSPLLCVVDAVSILLRMLVSTYLGQSPLEALGTLLHERFKDSEGAGSQDSRQPTNHNATVELDDQSGGVQSLERMTWLRWLWFILGTLPPAIKLASMRGVPWTQVWGMIFLASWIINEGLVIFAAMNQSFFATSSLGRISWPGYEQTNQSSFYQRIQRILARIEICLASAALIVHIVIMNGAFRMVWRRLLKEYGYQSSIISSAYRNQTANDTAVAIEEPYSGLNSIAFWDYYMWSTISSNASIEPNYALSYNFTDSGTDYLRPEPGHNYTGVISVIFISACTAGVGFIIVFARPPLYTNRHASFIALPLFLLSLMLISTVANAISYQESFWVLLLIGSPLYVFLISTIVTLAFIAFFCFLGRRFVLLGRNLLLLSPNGNNGQWTIDHGACLSLAFFLSTVIASLLWYAFLYDPADTFNPKWTGVFG
jgi:hypothetical protein